MAQDPDSDRTVSTGRESDKFMLRLPEGMRERIRQAAEMNQRSMNAEIVATLTKAYPDLNPIAPIVELLRSWTQFGSPLSDDEVLKLAHEIEPHITAHITGALLHASMEKDRRQSDEDGGDESRRRA